MPSKKSKVNQKLGRSVRSIREQKRFNPREELADTL